MYTRTTLLILAITLTAGCEVDSVGDPSVDPADLAPPDEATLAGAAPIVLPEAAPVTRGEFHGEEDSELQAFLTAAPGVRGWEAVREDEPPEAALDRLAGYHGDPARGFSYVGMVTERGHYLIEIEDDAMTEVRDVIEMVAEPGTSGPADAPIHEPAHDDGFRGWSNGTDSRVRRTGSAIPGMVGLVNGGCSGALIGRRLVRTAAHCVITHTAGGGVVNSTVSFDYRRDADTIPVSTQTGSFYYGGGYLPNNCGVRTSTDYWSGYRANFDTCSWKDWAILILSDNWNGNTWHSWFGYKGLVGGDIDMELQSGGYPGCGLAESPSGCVSGGYYRDTSSPCRVSAWTSGTSKFRSGCDVSPGHSGGPAWEEGTAYLIGHVQWQDCSTCPSGSTNRSAPNHFLGHDTWLFNFQNSLRAQFP